MAQPFRYAFYGGGKSEPAQQIDILVLNRTEHAETRVIITRLDNSKVSALGLPSRRTSRSEPGCPTNAFVLMPRALGAMSDSIKGKVAVERDVAHEAITDAFKAHVAALFRVLCVDAGDGHHERAKHLFYADFRFALRIHDEAVAELVTGDDRAAREASDAERKAYDEEVAFLARRKMPPFAKNGSPMRGPPVNTDPRAPKLSD